MRGINSKLLIRRDLWYVTSHVHDNRRVSHVGVGPSLLTYGAGTTRHSPAPLQLGPLLAGGAIQLPIANSFVFNIDSLRLMFASLRCAASARIGRAAVALLARMVARLNSHRINDLHEFTRRWRTQYSPSEKKKRKLLRVFV